MREYIGVLVVIACVTAVAWWFPVSYHALGHIYLLVVILLCLRVGRGPVLFAAIASAVVWNYAFIPPRFSLHFIDLDDGILLIIYVSVALIAGQLIARIREQELEERQREQRSTALFHLTRAVATAGSLDEAVAAALRQAETLFGARSALFLASPDASIAPHPAGSLAPDPVEIAAADTAARDRSETGRFSPHPGPARALHLPLVRDHQLLGVFSLRPPDELEALTPAQRELIEAFAAQIALLLERENLRAAGERERFFAESDRLHRTLLDSVSHELKTPLAVLRSAGEKLPTVDATRLAGLSDEIRTATRRLDRLVANLLNQTRLESGALKPRLDWCDARDLIHAARRAVGPALDGRPFQLFLPDDLPLVRADAPLMEQALSNLLLNAALHTPPGSPITVAAGLDSSGPAARFVFTISDRGPGLPPEVRGRLFQKFQRGPAARAGGLGLGLSIVRGFMNAQGGDVSAGDASGGGARFTLTLPHFSPESALPDDR